MSKARGLADLGNAFSDGALSNRNLIINGAMQVAQRGDFSSAATFISGQYWLDRWIFDTNNANSLVSQVGVDVPELSSKTKAARVEAGTTGSSYLGIRQKLEFPENYAGKTYTFSAYVRSNNVNARLTGYFVGPNQVIASDTHTGDGSWQRLSVTFTFSTTAASVAYFDGYISSNTVGPVSISAGDYLEITGVQLEVGDTATPFEHRSYGDELARCQRYFEKTYNDGVALGTSTGAGQASYVCNNYSSGTVLYGSSTFYRVPKRAVPSLSFWSYNGVANEWFQGVAGFSEALHAAPLLTGSGETGFQPYMTTVASNANTMYGHWAADAEL